MPARFTSAEKSVLTGTLACCMLSGCWWQHHYTLAEIQDKGVKQQFNSPRAPAAVVRCIERNADNMDNRYVGSVRELDPGLELTLHTQGKEGRPIALVTVMPWDSGSSVTLYSTPAGTTPRSLAYALRRNC